MLDEDEEMQKPPPESKRMFVNHVDSYQGKNLAKYISQCVVGASLEAVEEEEEDAEEGEMPPRPKEGLYEVVGTLKNKDLLTPDYLKEVVKFESRDALYEQLLECDVIVYDITEDPDQIDEAVWVATKLHSDVEKCEKNKIFILVSTVLTWASSKTDPDDPEIPFTEDDYRRRKPHPNFKEHISAEKLVIKFGKTSKTKLVTYVIASGLTYGAGENLFHYLFKAAWHNAPDLVCYGDGKNIVPTIHVRDLAAVVQNVADSKPKVRYIIAVDDSKDSMRKIAKTISKVLSTGQIRKVSQEEALLKKEIKQEEFDMLMVNLRMDAVYMKENMHIKYASETGLVENIVAIVKEYKETRGLLPIRVFIHGPPASGKSTVVQQLCKQFKLHHLRIKDVIDETIEKMRKYIEDAELREKEKEKAAEAEQQQEEEEEEEDDDEEEEDKTGEYTDLLATIKETMEQNNGRLEDEQVLQFFKDFLHSKPCQNQGFILDGFPKTVEQAAALFAKEGEDDGDDETAYDKSIMPELIISLESSEEFLRERVMNLPESVVSGTHNTEDGFLRRYTAFKDINNDDDTVLNYFDELEIHPEKIDITTDTSEKMIETVNKIAKLIGQPRNYGPTVEEQAILLRLEAEETLRRETAEREEREKYEIMESNLKKQRQEDWTRKLDDVKREECQLLETHSVPLRNYLMQHVMPTLTKGLRDCVQVRPEDPIDFLAEYLFKNNCQVD